MTQSHKGSPWPGPPASVESLQSRVVFATGKTGTHRELEFSLFSFEEKNLNAKSDVVSYV